MSKPTVCYFYDGAHTCPIPIIPIAWLSRFPLVCCGHRRLCLALRASSFCCNSRLDLARDVGWGGSSRAEGASRFGCLCHVSSSLIEPHPVLTPRVSPRCLGCLSLSFRFLSRCCLDSPTSTNQLNTFTASASPNTTPSIAP